MSVQLLFLAKTMGEDVTEALERDGTLKRLGEGLKTCNQASYSVTFQFSQDVNGVMSYVMKPRERVPLESIEHKVLILDGQLSLFDSK